jgi:hypothetical protein
MEFPQSSVPDQPNAANAVPVADKQVQPTPDYGTLGPGSDVSQASASVRPPRFASFVAVAIGVLLAVLVGSLGRAQAAWSRLSQMLRPQAVTMVAPASAPQLDRMKPQKQAEALLELAVAHGDGAVDEISSRVDGWQGQLTWDSQMASLTTAALNSNDMRVRESAIDVELSAYGLAKNSRSLEYLFRTVASHDHARKIWALWALGLMGNRGIESERVTQTLTAHLKDSDEDSRHWAVEGLALVGSDQALPVLLAAMHDDSSPVVREEAACAIAQSGMFTRDQRLSTVPQLLGYTDDSSLDAQTHQWAFQALTDITGQRLPNDSAAWRSWYASRN